MKKSILMLGLSVAMTASAKEYLVKVKDSKGMEPQAIQKLFPAATEVKNLNFKNWVKIDLPENFNIASIQKNSRVEYIQPNYKVSLFKNPQLEKLKKNSEFMKKMSQVKAQASMADNPTIPSRPVNAVPGDDPLFNKQWGMNDIGVKQAWNKTRGNQNIVVAVIDTGVDYTHEDLNPNIWRNAGETGVDANGNDRATNGIDDDNNGFVDDVIGWDFVSNDNKPFDLAVEGLDLFKGGNPGHGTHCAGNVAARGNNAKGIAGVAPNVQIMVLRFLGEAGQGTIEGAINSVKYAVDNGAHILSNSWGAVVDRDEALKDRALQDVIEYSEQQGRLFVAAAGNGDQQGRGYDNDLSRTPAYPASYPQDIIVSVAAIDSSDNLGTFSNWGVQSVDIGAPGVKVFSTTVLGRYSDLVLDKFGFTVYWDGTSMATPHVAGAAALYLSQHPNASWRDIKNALIQTAQKTPTLQSKVVSGGKLDVEALLAR